MSRRALGHRQVLALELLAERGELTALELGAELHAVAGTHPATSSCPWCRRLGAEVLASLAGRKLLVLEDARAATVRRRT